MSENLASGLGGLTGMEPPTDREPDEDYITHNVANVRTVKLGRQGENLTQTVQIDCTAWNDKLPGCTLVVVAIRPGEAEAYLPEITVQNGVITWPIKAQDTACPGLGRAEVRAMVDGKIKKSAIFHTMVETSLTGDGSYTPVTAPDWVQIIIDGMEAEKTAGESAAAAATYAANAAAAAKQAADKVDDYLGADALNITKEEILALPSAQGAINNTGLWSNVTAKYQHVAIPVPRKGCMLRVELDEGSISTYLCGVTDYVTPVLGDAYMESANMPTRLLSPAQSYNIAIPDDVNYILLMLMRNNGTVVFRTLEIVKDAHDGIVDDVRADLQSAGVVRYFDDSSLEHTDSYVQVNGSINVDSGRAAYAYTEPVHVLKGSIVTVDAVGHIGSSNPTKTVAVIAKYVSGQYVSVLPSNAENDYTWVADEGCDLVFSYKQANGLKVKIVANIEAAQSGGGGADRHILQLASQMLDDKWAFFKDLNHDNALLSYDEMRAMVQAGQDVVVLDKGTYYDLHQINDSNVVFAAMKWDEDVPRMTYCTIDSASVALGKQWSVKALASKDDLAKLSDDYAQQIVLLKAVRDALKGGDIDGAVGLLDTYLLDKEVLA